MSKQYFQPWLSDFVASLSRKKNFVAYFGWAVYILLAVSLSFFCWDKLSWKKWGKRRSRPLAETDTVAVPPYHQELHACNA